MTGSQFFDLSDYRRSYLLPDTVTANIPRRPAPGEPGALAVARGVLVELGHAVGGRPVSLTYTERCDPATGRFIDTAVTAVVATTGQVLAVALTYGSTPNSPSDYWQITIDGPTGADLTGRYLPSPPMLARLIALALEDSPSPRG